MLFAFLQCALKKKLSGDKSSESHWMDRAIPEYGDKFVSDVKAFLSVLVLYSPLPIYWALWTQHISRWQFQASR